VFAKVKAVTGGALESQLIDTALVRATPLHAGACTPAAPSG